MIFKNRITSFSTKVIYSLTLPSPNNTSFQNILDGATSMVFPKKFSYNKIYEKNLSKRASINWLKGIKVFNKSYLSIIKKENNDKKIS